MDRVALRAEILETLSDVAVWRLTPPAWSTVEDLVADLEQAWTAGDLDGAAACLAELELCGPVRIARIGAPAVGPPPASFRPVELRLRDSLNGIGDGETSEPVR